MTIEHAILGFLSWRSFTGYELKREFADSPHFHWSGNNNQIYKTLVDLHRRGLVTVEVQPQVNRPSRKVYTVTDEGLLQLRRWATSPPELPRVRNPFLVQLAWADQLEPDDLEALLARYEHEIEVQLLMIRERERRGYAVPARTPRETRLWKAIAENSLAFYENELAWVRRLRRRLAEDCQSTAGDTAAEEVTNK